MPSCDVKTRYIPATFAWTLLLGATTLFFYFPAQYYIFRYPWVPAYQGLITFFVLANFTLATFMDPGVIPKAPPDEDREDDFRAPLYKNVDINGITVRMKWCVTCKFYRPPRCSHCSVCNHCIETFDHHCPWVNNCIGRRNYRFFFFFLISLSLHMISIFTLSLIFVLQNQERLTEKEPIISIVLMVIVLFLAVPIFGLTGFHMVLVSRGRTTNEQVTGKFKGGYNPFSRGCWDNCCYTQFGPQFPSLMKPSKYHAKKKHCSHGGPIATITNDSQVKTYMDNGNGIRTLNSNAYNKLSQGRISSSTNMPSTGGDTMLDSCTGGGDTMEQPSASQSLDCDPTPPPLQRHGSKTNFFLPPIDIVTNTAASSNNVTGAESPRGAGGGNSGNIRGSAGNVQYARHSPHPRPRGGGGGIESVGGGNGRVQEGGNGGTSRPSPTMQQRIKALGIATPLALSSSPIRRSNPSTPTQPRRPDFISVTSHHTILPQSHHHQQHHHLSQHHLPAVVSSVTSANTTPSSVNNNNAAPGNNTTGSSSAGYYDYQSATPPSSQSQSRMIGGGGGGGYGAQHYVNHYQHNPHHGSPQRRFMSEGELVRGAGGGGGGGGGGVGMDGGGGQQLTSYARGNNTVDNIRELANSPQRGVYMWKDSSPGYPPPVQSHPDFYRSNPTSPTQQQLQLQQQQQPPPQPHHQQQQTQYQQQQQSIGSYISSNPPPRSTYHPAMRGGVPVYPPQSPQIHRKTFGGGNLSQQQQAASSNNTPPLQQQTLPADTRRRPMSFVRALEMSDTVDLAPGGGGGATTAGGGNVTATGGNNHHLGNNSGGAAVTTGGAAAAASSRTTSSSPDRTSVYDMNYEISV